MTTLEEIPVEDIGQTSLNTVANLLHSTELESMTFVRPLEDGGGELVEVVVGQASEEDGHVILSTYGIGGVETTGTLRYEDKEYPYHAEFFAVGRSVPDAKAFAEELAKIGFIVSANEQPLVPGTIIGGVAGDEESFYYFSDAPLGIQAGHGVAPILTPDFALAFVAVTKLYKSEVDLLQTEGGHDKLIAFMTSLGNDAYALGRKAYVAEIVAETETDEDAE